MITKTYNHNDYEIIRLSYKDGLQHGNGPTLFYRGEFMIRYDDKIYSLRPNLPVMPELIQLHKFNSHREIHKYFIHNDENKDEHESEYNRCFVMPKIDGSLLCATCVHKHSVAGKYILENNNEFIIEFKNYVIFIGSRSCLFVSETDNMKNMILKSIISTYGSIKNMATYVLEYVINNINNFDAVTVIFECVYKEPIHGLVVNYNKDFVKHISCVYNVNGNNYIKLFDNFIEEINCKDINEYFHKKEKDALDGMTEDLEGIMVAFTNNDMTKILYVKMKFQWYYYFHKAHKYLKECDDIINDNKYKNIIDKIVMCKPKRFSQKKS